MRIRQNRPLDKFMRFLFMRTSIFMHSNVWRDKNLCSTNLCDRHLTRIIRVTKTRASLYDNLHCVDFAEMFRYLPAMMISGNSALS